MVGVAIALALLYLVILSSAMSYRIVLWFGLLLIAVSFSRYLVDFGSAPPRVETRGIAAAVPGLSSVDMVIIALACLGVILGFKRCGWQWILPAWAGLLIGALLMWPPGENVNAGVVHLAISLAAWPVGNWLGQCTSQSLAMVRGLAFSVLAFCSIQLGVCLWQILNEETRHGRTEGTIHHPSTLGKIVLLLFILILPMTQSRDRVTARLAALAVATGSLATLTTISRANIVGLLAMLVLWLTFSRTKSGSRWRASAVAGVLVVAALPLQEKIFERFTTDLEGGVRPELWEAGLEVIAEYFWTGVGPNNFVETSAPTEWIISLSGQPIHNTFLLTLAELGIFVSIVFYLPLMRTIYVAAMSTRGGPESAQVGRVLLIGFAAVIFVGWTGWGFLRAPVLEMLFFVFGFVHGQLLSFRLQPSFVASTRQLPKMLGTGLRAS